MTDTKRTLSVLKVFISSPSDVADARESVRLAVDRVNRLVAKPNSILFESFGWEDIPTGKAERIQDLITPYVHDCDIYIGILNRRFGSPTGQAESGTKEEYDLICKRWKNEDQKPAVKVFFKKIPSDELEDPSPQLRKVLEFRDQIARTDLYHEFESEDKLAERVEKELAAYVYTARGQRTRGSETKVGAVPKEDIRLMEELVRLSYDVQGEAGCQPSRQEGPSAEASQGLRDLGLAWVRKGRTCLSDSTPAFLAIAKQMAQAGKLKSLLKSEYYRQTLGTRLPEVVLARFHCQLEVTQQEALRKLALMSPSASEYLLFGDTELYDNLERHARTITQESLGQKMLFLSLLHRMVLDYAEDGVSGALLPSIDGRQVEAQVFRCRIAAAHSDGLSFSVESVFPSVWIRAGEAIDKGQMISAGPDFSIRVGALMAHMEEFDLAIQEFDKVLTNSAAAEDVRFAALNDKGLVLLKQGRLDDAEKLFMEATQILPEREEPLRGLERVRELRESGAGVGT